MRDYTNSEMAELIDEYIHNAKYRAILKDRLINGMVYERLADTYEMSVTQVKRIVYKYEDKLFAHLK